ncbi:MAG: hypothetical protein Tsb002_37110 [Wenzhouxiangellaceae bacterium]
MTAILIVSARRRLPMAGLGLMLLAAAATVQALTIEPAVSDEILPNPHRGLMLWGTTYGPFGPPDNFYNANVYHVYLPWREIETADQVFDWAAVEQRHFQPIFNDHPQATLVLRLVADYPDGPGSGINAHYSGGDDNRDYPLFLEQPPLNIPATNYSSCDGDGPGRAPDWNHPAMATQMQQLIAAFADRYDGDPRITAVQVGLLGLWGEWHQSGCPALAPDSAIKQTVRTAYDTGFQITPLQTRYARDPDVVGVDFGFHEDFFPSFTTFCVHGLPLCSDTGDWNLDWGLTNVVPAARDNWQHNPVSGESPLTVQQDAWIDQQAAVLTLLSDLHFSLLGPAGLHERPGLTAQLAPLQRQLGYRLHLSRFITDDQWLLDETISLSAEFTNLGSAPHYHDQQIRLSLLDDQQQSVWSTVWPLPAGAPLPQAPLMRNTSVLLTGIAPGDYQMVLALEPAIPGRPGIILSSLPRDGAQRLLLGPISVLDNTGVILRDGFESAAVAAPPVF